MSIFKLLLNTVIMIVILLFDFISEKMFKKIMHAVHLAIVFFVI